MDDQYKKSHLIYLGEVVSLKSLSWKKENQRPDHKVTLKVLETYKNKKRKKAYAYVSPNISS